MYCKFKEGDLVMVKRDTKSYHGATIRKWVCGTVMTHSEADSRYDGYVYVGIMNAEKDKICGLTIVPIKDLKKISDKKIPKGSYSGPRFNNGDHVLYKGETGLLAIESWIVDNKPYYNECRIVIRTASGKYIFVNECDTQMFNDCGNFDTEVIPKHLFNSVYGMAYREFEDCVNDVIVTMNLMKHEQKLKEVSNMLNDGRIIQYKREGNTITATLYDTKEIGNGSNSHSPIASASAKCRPDDRFNINLGMQIAFERLSAKWKLINNGWSNFDKGAFSVRVNKEDVKRFLKMLDEADYIWMDGQKIFDFVDFFALTYEIDDVLFTAYSNHRVTWSDTLLDVSKCISFDEFCELV